MAMICSGCLNIKSSSFASHPSQTRMQQNASSQSLTSSRSRSVRPICMYLSRWWEIESCMPLSMARLRVSNKKHWTSHWKCRVTVSWPPSSFGARYIWSCQRIRSEDRTCNNLWQCYSRPQDLRAYCVKIWQDQVQQSSTCACTKGSDLVTNAKAGEQHKCCALGVSMRERER